MTRPRLLDLYCKAGGMTRGYQEAGFYVVGVDHEPQPNYCGDAFILADALEVPLEGYDALHASPPCHDHSALSAFVGEDGTGWLLAATRERLRDAGVPWVLENVPGAPMPNYVRLCGSSFGLHVRRHRWFETSFPLLVPPCHHPRGEEIRAYYGNGGPQVQRKGRKPLLRGSVAQAPADMGIDWMTWDELTQAIPPAYARHLGSYLMAQVRGVAA